MFVYLPKENLVIIIVLIEWQKFSIWHSIHNPIFIAIIHHLTIANWMSNDISLFVDYWGLCGGVVELLTGVSRGLYIRELPTLFTLGGISIHDWLWLFCWLFLGVVSLIRVLPTKCISFCFWFWLRAELRGAELSKSPQLVSLLCNYSVHAQCAMPKTVFWKYFRKSRKPQSHRKEILRKINQK